jgi:hypothetical protein
MSGVYFIDNLLIAAPNKDVVARITENLRQS